MKFNTETGGELHERQGKGFWLGVYGERFKVWRNRLPFLNRLSFKICLLSFVLLLILGSFVRHPYYMSVTEIEYRPQQKELQISCKIFMDDLEDALKAEAKKPVKLNDDSQKDLHQAMIYKYLQQHFKLVIDGKPVTFDMLGFEKEQEAVWNYLVVKNVAPFKTIMVYNDVLYQLRDGQINIIHLKANNKTQSYRLNAPTAQHLFQ